MSTFGTVLFKGSPFIRWTISPAILFTMLFLPATMRLQGNEAVAILVCLELLGASLITGLWTHGRLQNIAFRITTLMVLILYIDYFLSEFSAAKPLNANVPRSDASEWNAFLGLIVIGVPCFWFTLRGRFPSKPDNVISPEDIPAPDTKNDTLKMP